MEFKECVCYDLKDSTNQIFITHFKFKDKELTAEFLMFKKQAYFMVNIMGRDKLLYLSKEEGKKLENILKEIKAKFLEDKKYRLFFATGVWTIDERDVENQIESMVIMNDQ